MLSKSIFVIFLFLFFSCQCRAQDTIVHCEIKNPSFEEFELDKERTPWIVNWEDCGDVNESPSNLHKGYDYLYGVNRLPNDGKRFISLVTRYNETWESIGQKLEKKLIAGENYFFWVSLARSDNFSSKTYRSRYQEEEFSTNVIVRIYLGNKQCDKQELIYKSYPIEETEWSDHKIDFVPLEDYTWIIFEAFYMDNSLFPYNGNVLVDYFSTIMRVVSKDD